MRSNVVRRNPHKYPSGMSMVEVAQLVGVACNTLHNYERKPPEYWRIGMWKDYLELTGLDEESYREKIMKRPVASNDAENASVQISQ